MINSEWPPWWLLGLGTIAVIGLALGLRRWLLGRLWPLPDYVEFEYMTLEELELARKRLERNEFPPIGYADVRDHCGMGG